MESIRAPELIFQPSMVGSAEAGLAETINFVLKMFTETEQQALVNNVFLTGACAKFPGTYYQYLRFILIYFIIIIYYLF